MRHISPENEIILDNLKKRFQLAPDSKLSSIPTLVGNDFNSASFSLITHPEDKKIFILKYRIGKLDEIVSNISEEFDNYLKETFGEWYKGREGNDVTFEINTIDISDEEKEKALALFPKLQVHVMVPVFKHAFDQALNEGTLPATRIPFREADESIYLFKNEGNVLVYFSILLDKGVDRELGTLFLQEMKDSKRVNARQLGSSPNVNFTSGSVPQELLDTGLEFPEKEKSSDYLFVVFSLFDRHISKESLVNTVTKLIYFRPYLDYHIKCSKGYMHIRFRDRVVKLLDSLEAAKDKSGIEKVRKTASGRFLSSHIASERGRV